MNDSQSQKKKPKMFLRAKENKNAPAKVQKPQRVKKTETVVYDKKEEVAQKPQEVTPIEPPPKKKKTQYKKQAIILLKKKYHTVRMWINEQRVPTFKIKLPTKLQTKKTKKQDTRDSLFKQLETDLQLALVPLILLAILAIFMLLNNHYLKIISDNSLPQVESVASIQPFPLAENVIPPDISAKAAIVLDADTQVILLSKNEDLRFSMASTTKIMTALTALDYFKEDDVLTIRTYGIDGSTIGLQHGDRFVFKDLLYAMLLPSANDAAVAIADNYSEGREAFVKKMNEKAAMLHLTNTHFADPTGLNDDENYTTVVDLARLGSFAMKNKLFAEIVGTQEKLIYNTSYSRQYPLNNLNRLLGIQGVNGIKTGTTEGAGEVLVTSKVTNGHTYIIVVMNSTDRFADTRELLDFVDEKVRYIMPPMPK